MPTPFIDAVVKQTHTDRAKDEKTFKKVEESAKAHGARNPYAVATSVVEKMTGYHPKDK